MFKATIYRPGKSGLVRSHDRLVRKDKKGKFYVICDGMRGYLTRVHARTEYKISHFVPIHK
jgi:hypothetical protein